MWGRHIRWQAARSERQDVRSSTAAAPNRWVILMGHPGGLLIIKQVEKMNEYVQKVYVQINAA